MAMEEDDRKLDVWNDYHQLDRPPKPLEGMIVEIRDLSSPLKPNAETAKSANSESLDFNGKRGRCLMWDKSEEKYVVHTFDGIIVGVPEENLVELSPMSPEEGGFDVIWPDAEPMSYGLFSDMVGDCIRSKGYCVIQMFTNEAIRDAAVKEAKSAMPFDTLRAEFESGYLGNDNITKAGLLEMDSPDKVIEDALSYCDRDLTNMSLLMNAFGPDLGFQFFGRSCALVRTPFQDQVQPPPPLSDADAYDKKLEKFLVWIMRRKLCLLYCIENEGGTLELYPKEQMNMSTVKLPLDICRMIVFRHDLMGYSYQPEGESLALQTWIMDIPKFIQFRELPLPPGPHAGLGVHLVAGMERFPANCDDCMMTFAMFTAGTDCETMPPFTRFDKDLYWMEDVDAFRWGKAYHMHGSFVSDPSLLGFDNHFFAINDEEANQMSPAQRWILETGYECLHKGGWNKLELMGQRVGTFIGDSGSEWNSCCYTQDKYTAANNFGPVTISRLAYCLGLTGPNISVDTACSASLVAANSASHMMRSCVGKGRKDQIAFDDGSNISMRHALVMGILVMLSPGAWIGECAATMATFRGRCFTFDASADGFSRGEGCCSAYLKTVDDSKQDPTNRSLAVLCGSCANQDGRSASLTAPHGPSQQEVIKQSLREASIQPHEVMLSECHGTGTALGDPIEVGACRGVMIGKRELPILHTTAKAHTGHEEANAGTCGLLKIMLMLNFGCATPNPHIRALNPHLDTNGYPVLFNNELNPTCEICTNFGVSSFGFGGTNSRADLWADCEKGLYKEGKATGLSKEEAPKWIHQFIENVSTEKEEEGFLPDHKSGH